MLSILLPKNGLRTFNDVDKLYTDYLTVKWFAFQIGCREVCFSVVTKTTDNADTTQTTKHRYSRGTQSKGATTEVFHPGETIAANKAGILEIVLLDPIFILKLMNSTNFGSCFETIHDISASQLEVLVT